MRKPELLTPEARDGITIEHDDPFKPQAAKPKRNGKALEENLDGAIPFSDIALATEFCRPEP
jgi:hypothetical protein